MQRRERQRARRSTDVGGASTTKGAIVWCKWRTQNSRTNKVVGWGVGVRVYYYTVSDWWGVREGVGRGAGSTSSTVEAHP